MRRCPAAKAGLILRSLREKSQQTSGVVHATPREKALLKQLPFHLKSSLATSPSSQPFSGAHRKVPNAPISEGIWDGFTLDPLLECATQFSIFFSSWVGKLVHGAGRLSLTLCPIQPPQCHLWVLARERVCPPCHAARGC